MIRLLLLDYNGVIVDDEPLHFAALRDTVAESGIGLDAATYYAQLLGYDDRGCLTEVFRRAGRALEPAALDRLALRKAARYAALTRDGPPLVPGVGRFAREAAAAARIGVVSGALRREVVAGLALAGLADLVQVIVAAEDVRATKPDPEGYRRAVAALTRAERERGPRGAGPVRALVLEDSPPGLQAARALGAGCVLLATSHPSEALRRSGADGVWTSFEGHTPDELTPLYREVAAREHD